MKVQEKQNNKAEVILEMKDIVKTFPGVKALKGVDFELRAGEVHALMGENGAGKSTLVKCLIGIQAPTSGQIIFDGNELGEYNTTQALHMGMAMVHQELSPILDKSLMENIWLGREPMNKLNLIDYKKMYRMTIDALKVVGLDTDPRTLMRELTVAKMQMVEIAKAISYNAKLIIMDEPSSAITEQEVGQLFKVLRDLRDKGTGIIYITHKMAEVEQICDRVTVLRDGEYIATHNVSEVTQQVLISEMVGREITEMFPKIQVPIGETILEVRNLSDGKTFKDVSFEVKRGEIFGIAGLVGAGRTEIIETIFGIRPKVSGQILINGVEVNIRRPEDAIEHGMALLTEDRRQTGIFPILSVADNMIMAQVKSFSNFTGLLDKSGVKSKCQQYVNDLEVKTPSLEQQIQFLSGGNQQKVLIARWLMTEPEILFLDEPTRGIDVGAKAEIHKLLGVLAKENKAVIMISSELPEILGMSDRIMVVSEGRVTAITHNEETTTQEVIMGYASISK